MVSSTTALLMYSRKDMCQCRFPTVVAKVYGSQTSIQNNGVGVLVENSTYVTLDGLRGSKS